MSDLTETRDHLRSIAEWKPPVMRSKPGYSCHIGYHDICQMPEGRCPCDCHEDARPTGPTDAERALAARLADEIDEYLAEDRPPAEGAGLWEEGA